MTLWGGRFSAPPGEVLWAYTVTDVDRRLLFDDVRGSRAHVAMLAEVGLVAADEAEMLLAGLAAISAEAESGTFEFVPEDEDVHSAVERRLGELAGDVAAKLHTGRSRNDQVALDLRLYLLRAAGARASDLARLAFTLATRADELAPVVVASYTHLQQAQAVSLGHHLAAYGWMLVRDAERFLDARRRLAVSPLGAGASAGSTLPLDPDGVAARLGLSSRFRNSLDAVASRDFAAEYGFCCAQAMVHLSRLSEELVLWATEEFGWATYADEVTTGSSALPHKKNPDIAELARGKAAGVIGDLTALLALQKGLPLAYNRDLQEDKPPLFRADDALAATTAALEEMVATARFHPPPPSPWVTALDLAEALVRRGVPFRRAHQQVGGLVVALVADGRDLASVTDDDLAAAGIELESDAVPTPESSAASRPGAAGSPAGVSEQTRALRQAIAAVDAMVAGQEATPETS